MILFIVHSVLLFVFSYSIIRFLIPEKKNFETILYSYLLFWANILFTSFILSFFNILDWKILYFSLSVSIQFVVFIVLFRKNIGFRIGFPEFKIPKLRFDLYSLVIVFLSLIFVLQLILCFSYLPLTPDTLSSKLVKIYAFLQNHTLLPNPDFDGDLVFMSPINTAVTWMYFIIYKVSFRALHFFSLFNWVTIGFSSYFLCRKLEISKLASVISTALLICSDVFLLNATGDNDDILAASSFAIGVLAFVNWYSEKRMIYILLAGLALGISLGIKPFAALYYQLVIGIIVFYFIKYGIKSTFSFVRKFLLHGIVFVFAVLFMLFGVFYENYMMRGNPVKFSKVVSAVNNSPFSFKIAGINLVSQNMELFLTPALVPTGVGHREDLSDVANHLSKTVINNLFNTTQEEVNTKYSAHTNMTTIAYPLFYDHSVNFGFYPHLLLISALIGFLSFNKVRPIVYVLGLSFLFADIGYCIHNKYVMGIMRYWMIVFTITAPLIGFALDRLRKLKSSFVYKIGYPIFFIAFAYCIFTSFYGLFNNYYRSIGAIISYTNFNSYRKQISDRVAEILPKTPEFNVVYVNNYPNALIHNLAPDSKILSKNQVQEAIPNIIISQLIPLGIQNYSSARRIVNLTVDELKEDYFILIGNFFDAKFFMNRVPKQLQLTDEKKEVLFYFSQPVEAKSGENITNTGLVSKFKEMDSFESAYFKTDNENKEIQISPWTDFRETNLRFGKKDKTIIVKIRNKKTNKTYSNSYPI